MQKKVVAKIVATKGVKNVAIRKTVEVLLKKFNMPMEEYPELVREKKRGASFFYISKYLKKKEGDKEHRGLDRVEDLLKGEPEHLVHLVEALYGSGRKHEAKGVYMRHKLTEKDFVAAGAKPGVARDLENLKYDASRDYKPFEDMFEPVSTPHQEYLRLPVDMLVEFIGKEKDVYKLEVLIGQKYVGVDSEWRPKISASHKTSGIAILQLGGLNEAFIVDLLALRGSKKLDNMLTRIFGHKKSIILGFGFSADLA